MKNVKSKQMMLFLVVLFLSLTGKSQDLIVTVGGDSLNCKISKIKQEYILYKYLNKGKIRKSLLPLYEVTHYEYNYYGSAIHPGLFDNNPENYPDVRIDFTGGYSYRLAKISDDITTLEKEYMNKLKSGYHLGIGATYYFSEQYGVGLKYVYQKSSNEADVVASTPGGHAQYGKMSDNIRISFIGPYFSTRMFNFKGKNSFNINLGLGYLDYYDKAVLIDPFTIKGGTVGMCMDIGYDIGQTDNFAIGFQLSYIVGALSKYKISNGLSAQTIELDKDSYEGLSRIDFSIGIRILE